MKNIDNDIEQFEKNLIEIDTMRKQISELNTSLCEVLNETGDIDSIKENLKNEIELIHKTNDNSIKQIDEKIKELSIIATDVKNSMGKDTDKIVKPIESAISDLKSKQEILEKKIFVSSTITIIGFVIIVLILLLK